MTTKLSFQFIPILFACFALSQTARAVVPPPDGGYPGANTAEGQQALLSLSGGTFNTALGWFSLKSNLAGNYNTGVGAAALVLNTSDQNTATGAGALLLNTSGFRNTANGAFALLHNNAADNTATGNAALLSNTTGTGNTATGNFALVNNDTGSHNTAVGNGALSANIVGADNTAIGSGALASSIASGNTATGLNALFNNTSGFGNVAMGHQALFSNTSGNTNIGLGFAAGSGVSTADNVICIGAVGTNVSNTCFIGNISGVTLGAGSSVQVDANNQLGTIISSRRFKKDIEPMDRASEKILALKPVTFHYKSDVKGIAQFGLVAEDVAEVSPDMVIRDSDGKPYTVRYDAVNVMLLNEFLKEHRKVQELQIAVADQQKRFESRLAKQEKQIEALTSGLQRVSTQLAAANPSGGGLEASNPTTKVVANEP